MSSVVNDSHINFVESEKLSSWDTVGHELK